MTKNLENGSQHRRCLPSFELPLQTIGQPTDALKRLIEEICPTICCKTKTITSFQKSIIDKNVKFVDHLKNQP